MKLEPGQLLKIDNQHVIVLDVRKLTGWQPAHYYSDDWVEVDLFYQGEQHKVVCIARDMGYFKRSIGVALDIFEE